MAKVKAPLFGFNASGQIGKAIVYGDWKGINWARVHVVPANPKSDNQVTQRDALSDCVSAYKNYFTNALGRAAWKRIALRYAGALSGFNAFIRNTLKLIVTDPDASFCSHNGAFAAQTIAFSMLNIDDGAAGDEAGNFEIWVGTTVTNMILNEEVAIAAGGVTGTNALGDAGDVVYSKVRKGGYDRSGIFKTTLI